MEVLIGISALGMIVYLLGLLVASRYHDSPAGIGTFFSDPSDSAFFIFFWPIPFGIALAVTLYLRYHDFTGEYYLKKSSLLKIRG